MKLSLSRLTFALAVVAASFLTLGASQVSAHSPNKAEDAATPAVELVPRGEKTALLLVFHGSPAPSWSKFTGKMVDRVRALNEKTPLFAVVEGAQMEFSKAPNDIASAYKRIEEAGCDAVVAVPVFIYPTSHVQFDVASILGIYASAEMRAALAEEGIQVVRSKIPTVATPTLSSGNLLKNFVVAEARSISKEPKNERLLVIAHGDEGYAGLVDSLNEDALKAAAELGFDRVDAAFCGIGQTFAQNVKPIVEANDRDGKKTLIVAIYVASSAESFVARLQKGENGAKNSLEGLNYECSKGALGDFGETAPWIFELGREASLF